MNLQAYWTLFVIALMLIGLAGSLASTELILFTALAVFLLSGVISPAEALAGFSNVGVVTIALLFVVSAAIQSTGALNRPAQELLGTNRKGGVRALLLRMMVPVSVLSAFLNNTAIVTIFMPIIRRWTEKLRVPASKFFIPLSYATLLGGMCTLIGTSTNLVVHGLIIESGMPGFSLFELAKIGIPCTILGLLYIAFVGERTLPSHKDMTATLEENSREYVVEMKVKKSSDLEGKTVKQAGLRNLRGLFLLDIERKGVSLGPISSSQTIQADDRLMFVGITSAIVDLQDIPGLVPAAHKMFEKDFASMRTHLIEAVVSSASPILGKTVKESNFRGKYGAGVIAVHRNGERIKSKIGDIRLRAGDSLLLFTTDDFMNNWQNSQDFFLISYVKDKPPDVSDKGLLSLGITLLMIVGAAIGSLFPFEIAGRPVTVLHFVLAAVMALLLTRCIRLREAKQSLRGHVLIAIACAFGISKALQNSGVAAAVAGALVECARLFGPHGVLIAIYLVTNLSTEIITNNAAAVLVFPVAQAAALSLGVNPMPFYVAIAIAASAGFSTPIGYQTHLIVQGAGRYRFKDYLKVGPALNLLCFAVATVMIPWFWPF